jgi:hypothetical protein
MCNIWKGIQKSKTVCKTRKGVYPIFQSGKSRKGVQTYKTVSSLKRVSENSSVSIKMKRESKTQNGV